MQLENVGRQLAQIIDSKVTEDAKKWLNEKIDFISKNRSTKDLYLAYSLIATKIPKEPLETETTEVDGLIRYLQVQCANVQQLARIYLLIRVLEDDSEYFADKVANIIQVADTGELETFLKFLILLPNPDRYNTSAVDALRTNISTIFNAIALNNPYPAQFFNEQQWNQMYLKTAFMQGDLSAILDIDKRANKELTRIISDYAHERWAASRDIDPYFWRPVAKFLDDTLLADMKRLLDSDSILENRAGALCCYYSGNTTAEQLLENYPDLKKKLENEELSWKTLKQ